MSEILKSKDEQLDQLLLESEKNPEALVDLLARFADAIADRMDIAYAYDQTIIAICRKWKNEYKEAEGMAYIIEALSNYYKTFFHKVDTPVRKALSIFDETGHKDLFGLASMVCGANKRSLGEIDDAVKHLMNGSEAIDPHGSFGVYCCYCYYQLAEICVAIKDHDAARENYQLTAEIAERINSQTPLFRAYNGLGNLLSAEGKTEEALEYLNKSLKIGTTISQRSRVLCDLGIFNIKQNNPSLAAEQLKESYSIRIENDFEDAASTSLIYLSEANLKLGKLKEALNNIEEALSYTQKFNSKAKMSLCYQLLWKIHEAFENWKEAVSHFKMYDELQNELNAVKLQNIYKLQNQKIADQKKVIEEIHEEVQDSIRYAKRIQSAILPPDKLIHEFLPNSFVLYKPKDIVAGDFYWMERIGNRVLFAAADCTGHGVPGAMVSVVCNNGLNRSVREYGLTDPGEILDKTREIVIDEFEKSEEEVMDGMDIALCTLEGNTLKYAGANNPLWIIRNNEIIEFKANKQPIGKFDLAQPFQTHTIELLKGDSFYIFSDGFVDQFGGERGKKFKPANLKKALLSIQGENMTAQKPLLDKVFEEWKSELEQVDDVCMIGVRI